MSFTNRPFAKSSYGFTLLEIMVAIGVFAVISLLSMGGLNNILNTQEHTEAYMDRLTKIQMTFAMMSREFQQILDAPVRDEYGGQMDSITTELSDGSRGLEFTHQGRFSFDNSLRVQRVAYFFENNKLVKNTWSVLDRVEDSKPLRQKILTDIDGISFAFFQDNKQKQEQEQALDAIPWSEDLDNSDSLKLQAIKVTIQTKDYGEIYRVFELGR